MPKNTFSKGLTNEYKVFFQIKLEEIILIKSIKLTCIFKALIAYLIKVVYNF
jgi:hypothetical protein